MSDTVRSKSVLLSEFASNAVGAITAQQTRDLIVSVDPEAAVSTGTLAAPPTPTKGGWVFLPSDAPYLVRDTGAALEYWGPVWKMTIPVDGDYSWVNQGGASVVVNGSIHLTAPGAATDNIRARVKSAPATPYTITAFMRGYSYPGSSGYFGLCFTNGTAIMTFGVGTGTGGTRNQLTKWNTSTSFNSNYLDNPALSMEGNWLRIADDGANRICSFSPDGYNWVAVHSIGRTDFLTATTVGFFLQTNIGTGKNIGATLFSWKEG